LKIGLRRSFVSDKTSQLFEERRHGGAHSAFSHNRTGTLALSARTANELCVEHVLAPDV
jgi:hypothetical protein